MSGDDTSMDSDVSTVSESDEAERTSLTRSTTCSSEMPHVYVVEDCNCVSNPTSDACANAKAYFLGCCDKTGI